MACIITREDGCFNGSVCLSTSTLPCHHSHPVHAHERKVFFLVHLLHFRTFEHGSSSHDGGDSGALLSESLQSDPTFVLRARPKHAQHERSTRVSSAVHVLLFRKTRVNIPSHRGIWGYPVEERPIGFPPPRGIPPVQENPEPKAGSNGSTRCETKHRIACMDRRWRVSRHPHASDGRMSCCSCIRRGRVHLATSANRTPILSHVLWSRASPWVETGEKPRWFPIQP